ncbi:MAG TPA: glycerophosphodiester phosphodiesterase [Acidimicrobiales bacterium]|nr:glycerophosphodiester phosphodiesterase [Acidimicrobiales bacterium]
MEHLGKQGFDYSKFPGTPLVLGHRGASADRPENTIEAFAEARSQGADGVELDVRRSADGALVVHHDAVLAGGEPVYEVAVDRLPPSMPLLGAALDVLADMAVNIEVKNLPDEPGHDPDQLTARRVGALVVERGLTGAVIVSSFALAAVDAVRSVEPSVATGLLTTATADQTRALEVASARGHRFLHPHHLAVSTELVRRCHDAGLDVVTWTVDDPDRVRWLAEAGVDGLITNRPAVALAALGRG